MTPSKPSTPPRRPCHQAPIPSAVFKWGLNGLLALSEPETETPILVNGRWNGHALDLAALQELVETYNPEAQPAPVKLTHATEQKKAYGWVKALRLADWTPPGFPKPVKTIFAKLSLTEEGRAAVTSGAYRMKSIEAWPREHTSNPTPGKWNFRALALLGSESPGCPNLTPLTLAAEDDEPDTPVLILQADSTPNPGGSEPPSNEGGAMALTPEEKARLDAAEQRNKDLEAKLAAQDKTVQETKIQTRLEGLVKDARLTPAQAAVLKPVLLSLADEGVVNLAEGKTATPREALFSLLEAAPQHTLFKGLQLPGTDPVELQAKDATTKAMQAAVDKHKAAGKPHAEAVALAAQEVDGAKRC